MHPIVDKVREAGIVGAGGAGFPAHAKYGTTADIVIANGAECEPLLYKDKELMLHYPEEVKKGMLLVAEAVGASRIILGIKAKNTEVIGQFRRVFGGTNIEIFEMHHNTKKDIPSGTALKVVEEIKLANKNKKVIIHSSRVGQVVGEHKVVLGGLGERLEITHKVDNRDLFAQGALKAAEYLVNKSKGFINLKIF